MLSSDGTFRLRYIFYGHYHDEVVTYFNVFWVNVAWFLANVNHAFVVAHEWNSFGVCFYVYEDLLNASDERFGAILEAGTEVEIT
ncbi:hypothetical protein Tco_0271704 [Tanacetum coccineum]